MLKVPYNSVCSSTLLKNTYEVALTCHCIAQWLGLTVTKRQVVDRYTMLRSLLEVVLYICRADKESSPCRSTVNVSRIEIKVIEWPSSAHTVFSLCSIWKKIISHQGSWCQCVMLNSLSLSLSLYTPRSLPRGWKGVGSGGWRGAWIFYI